MVCSQFNYGRQSDSQLGDIHVEWLGRRGYILSGHFGSTGDDDVICPSPGNVSKRLETRSKRACHPDKSIVNSSLMLRKGTGFEFGAPDVEACNDRRLYYAARVSELYS